ncbi:MAG: hypothetical protein FJ137_11675 [Deltaproteobacteria bacterium]|nr:hypothetical protein [Deltaproteobacteria bacterium]
MRGLPPGPAMALVACGAATSLLAAGEVPAAAAAAAAAVTPASPPSGAAARPVDLVALRAELKAKQAALSDLDVRERSLVDGLGELDESLALLDDAVRMASRRLAELTSEIATLERTAGRDEAELAALRARLQRRLRQLAVEGEGGAARALLGAEGFTELALRRRLLAQLAGVDGKLVGDLRRIEDSAARTRAALRERVVEAGRIQALVVEQQALLSATRDERARTLERVRGERSLLRTAATELVRRHGALQQLMTRMTMPARPASSGRAGILRDGLLWPVAEGVVIRRFGSIIDPETRAEVVSQGLELRGAMGTPVYAVAAGRVVHTGFLRGFGRVVIVDHGEGHHTLYAHLARTSVATGDELERGATIAEVGDTESVNGPKLYFELRENGRPRDPAPFLRR